MRLTLAARDSSRSSSPADGTGRRRILVAQAVLLALAAMLPLHPPAKGPMLLLPLDGAAPGRTLAWAIASGARPLGPGPYPGAWNVIGSRSDLVGPALRHSTLILAAGGAGCSFAAKDSNNE